MKPHWISLAIGLACGCLVGRSISPSTGTSATPSIEVGFSPDGRAEALVLQTISGARTSIHVSAYAFTSRPITEALVAARHRGVDVRVVADARSNQDSPYARAAFGALLSAGAQVRLNDRYAIHHDKFVIADDATVETGSFNYTASAATRNSENALVIHNDRALITEYQKHWQSRFNAGSPYRSGVSTP